MGKLKNIKCVYLYADWDRGFTKKADAFYEEMRRLGTVYYEVLNVEEKGGLDVSIKYGIRNVPALLVFVNNKLVGVEKGNKCHEMIAKYL